MMATLGQMFAWRDALWNVKPGTLMAGIGKGSGCFGAGNPSRREDRACPKTFGS
jgi:hypothetical protein